MTEVAVASDVDVVVGVVGKPLGLAGELFVRPDPDLEYLVEPGDVFETAGGVTLVVAAAREHSGRQVMRFEGVQTRDAAEALRGTVLRVARNRIPLAEDAFWSDELLGREVTDDSGDVVGVIEATLDGAAHDYLVVARPDGGEVLVPAVAELVDVGPDRIVVRPLPGLLDDEAW
ncbi:MAG: 16S rRNA processing protein RimM [Nitriliruptorales bacterium]|nr:16S rRNA processing protein RimM [Nitriliruptorales bacterium]